MSAPTHLLLLTQAYSLHDVARITTHCQVTSNTTVGKRLGSPELMTHDGTWNSIGKGSTHRTSTSATQVSEGDAGRNVTNACWRKQSTRWSRIVSDAQLGSGGLVGFKSIGNNGVKGTSWAPVAKGPGRRYKKTKKKKIMERPIITHITMRASWACSAAVGHGQPVSKLSREERVWLDLLAFALLEEPDFELPRLVLDGWPRRDDRARGKVRWIDHRELGPAAITHGRMWLSTRLGTATGYVCLCGPRDIRQCTRWRQQGGRHGMGARR